MNKNLTIDQCNELCKGTLMEHLGMKITVVEEGRVEATMLMSPKKEVKLPATPALNWKIKPVTR